MPLIYLTFQAEPISAHLNIKFLKINNMKKTVQTIGLFILVATSIVACSKSSDTTTTVATPLTILTVKDIPADTTTGLNAQGAPTYKNVYTFYSLEKNALVPNTDSATTKWDIAFLSTRIITNGGTSGTGMGGAFIYNGLFDDLKIISPDSVFKTDNAPTSYAITTGSGKGWYTYDGLNNLITPLAGRVLVIKTASGTYAKMEIISYYKGGVTLPASASEADKLNKQRYYTFRFAYQPNGTKNF